MQTTKNNNKDYRFEVYTYADGVKRNQVQIEAYEISVPNLRLAYAHFILHTRKYNFDLPSKYFPGSFRALLNYQYAIRLYIRERYQRIFGDDIVKWTLINEFCL